MRRLFFTCFLCFFCLLTLCQQSGFKSLGIEIDNKEIEIYKQSHAILIGVSDYLNNWPELPGVKEDIEAVKKALESHYFNVLILENPTKLELDNSISNFIAKYGQDSDNRLLFYFAGHGHTINTSYGEKLGYIVPADAPNPINNEALFQSKAIEMAQIEIYAKRIQSKHAIFLFDACFSGSLFAITRAVPQAITYKTREPIRQFITSGTENEQVPDKSIFRQQFISALISDEADGNNDGYLTGNELGEFLQTTVTNYSYNSQHPQYGKIRNPNLDKGDFVFILNDNAIQIKQEDKTTDRLDYRPLEETMDNEVSGVFIDSRDGHEYNWVRIGDNVWMAENLNYYIEDGSWCYKKKEDNCKTYGRLYTWTAASIACPDGWHLSTYRDWESFSMLYPVENQGGALKDRGLTYWKDPNTGATNNSGFSALPGGLRDVLAFSSINSKAMFWTATPGSKIGYYAFILSYKNPSLMYQLYNKKWGYSVRCVRDN